MHSQNIPEGNPSFVAADVFKLDQSKLTADDDNVVIPIERMEFWRNLESSLHVLQQMLNDDNLEG